MAKRDPSGFNVGRVLGNCIRILQEQFLTILVVSVPFCLLPEVVLGIIAMANPLPEDAGLVEQLGSQRLGNMVAGVLSMYASGGIIYAAASALKGKTVRIGQTFNKANGVFLAMWGIGILTTLGILIGFLFLIVPGVFLWLAWSVARPVRVMEKIDATEAISRSFDLTRGCRLQILVVMLVLWGTIIGGYAVMLAVIFAGAITGFSSQADALANLVLSPLWVTQITVSFAVGSAAIYHELINIKEGGGATVADVFA